MKYTGARANLCSSLFHLDIVTSALRKKKSSSNATVPSRQRAIALSYLRTLCDSWDTRTWETLEFQREQHGTWHFLGPPPPSVPRVAQTIQFSALIAFSLLTLRRTHGAEWNTSHSFKRCCNSATFLGNYRHALQLVIMLNESTVLDLSPHLDVSSAA